MNKVILVPFFAYQLDFKAYFQIILCTLPLQRLKHIQIILIKATNN